MDNSIKYFEAYFHASIDDRHAYCFQQFLIFAEISLRVGYEKFSKKRALELWKTFRVAYHRGAQDVPF